MAVIAPASMISQRSGGGAPATSARTVAAKPSGVGVEEIGAEAEDDQAGLADGAGHARGSPATVRFVRHQHRVCGR